MKMRLTLLLAVLGAAILTLASHNARTASRVHDLEKRLSAISNRLTQTQTRLEQLESSRLPRPELLGRATGTK